eukprot:TRINITY_DN16809_c0_g1_i1.p2 TRINITY_DN16809_c0_g1~~TRINITY_DN16809_c0_g1_i1.p2  ORF type:complete len:145 (+),score=54.48 TRINITY_DN16809_c0_g1_i1:44-436(+)
MADDSILDAAFEEVGQVKAEKPESPVDDTADLVDELLDEVPDVPAPSASEAAPAAPTPTPAPVAQPKAPVREARPVVSLPDMASQQKQQVKKESTAPLVGVRLCETVTRLSIYAGVLVFVWTAGGVRRSP